MIHLCFVWHMHQPFYKDLATGEYRLPWTRLHALKDYYGMVKVLENFPSVHQTFNLVPSMLVQIQEYAEGKAADPFLDCAVKPAEELTAAEKQFMLRYFFQANVERMINRYPRYRELFDAWKQSQNPFSVQDLRDLQVLSQLAWFDEEFLDHDAEVQALIAKERNYSLEDQAVMARKQREILASVIPVYKEFAARGQIEISTTPFYHPILPLICDSDVAGVSHPWVPLPSRFQYPEDARWQLQAARDFMKREFGIAPAGFWPSEGSVSDQALAIASEVGFTWGASDNGVLGRTLQRTPGVDVTYCSYAWKQNDLQIRMIFRDHFLSDLIGFEYSKMDAEEAATQFLNRIRDNTRSLAASGDVLVPIILDGENAWDYYHWNGRPFLRELYRQISTSPDLAALTVSEALQRHQPHTLEGIFPGSWINANFDVWIGAPEDNIAWEYLLRAHRKYDELAPTLDEASRKLAHQELMIAEGSDWCWWYGPEHQSENRPEFDQLYREHLANVYRELKQPPPDELSRPILTSERIDPHIRPSNTIRPVIDGQVTSYFEWMGAGRYRVENRSGAMHAQAPVSDLHYGSDNENFYLRLDIDAGAQFSKIDLRTNTAAISLLDTPEVSWARGRILEFRIPFRLLTDPTPNRPAPTEPRPQGSDLKHQFQVALSTDHLEPKLIPADGWIDFNAHENHA